MSEKHHHLDIRRDYPAPEFPRTPLSPDSLQNGLVVRMPNWLGDAIMALPALRQLKRMLPENCALGVICPAGLRPLFYSLPWVDLIIPLSNTHQNWTGFERRMVKRFSPGAGVLFNNSLRDTIMLRMCGVTRLYGAAARGRSILMRRSLDFPARRDHVLNKLHHANKYLSIAEALGAPKWDGVLPEIEIAVPFMQLNQTIRALCDHPKMLILAAGAAYGAAKRWKSENFREIARRWIASDGIVVCVGGPSEAPIGEEIAQGLSTSHCFNLMGKTDMYELMYLLKHSAAVLANDSGVMHLAAAFGRPGVAVFGSTDYTATGPIAPNWQILYSGRHCSPCFCRVCPHKTAECMTDITPDDAWPLLAGEEK